MSIADFLMGRLKQKNPQEYQFIQQVRQSGRDPGDDVCLESTFLKTNSQKLNQVRLNQRMHLVVSSVVGFNK